MRIHSFLSPKCQVRSSSISDKGVFASSSFAEGELVAVWGGKVYTADEVSQMAVRFPHFNTHPISVYNGYYLGSPNVSEFDDAEMFNHSCDPNVGVKGQIIVVARRPIIEGEELTFDYDTTETSAEPFKCRCGSSNCRGLIDGSGWRDPAFVKRNFDYLSWYIIEKLNKEQ